jgi:hypothetical protein
MAWERPDYYQRASSSGGPLRVTPPAACDHSLLGMDFSQLVYCGKVTLNDMGG